MEYITPYSTHVLLQSLLLPSSLLPPRLHEPHGEPHLPPFRLFLRRVSCGTPSHDRQIRLRRGIFSHSHQSHPSRTERDDHDSLDTAIPSLLSRYLRRHLSFNTNMFSVQSSAGCKRECRN